MSPDLPLRRVINAWGTATPFGVSRCSPQVADAAAQMLQRHVVMAELQAEVGHALAQWSGAPAACVTHCTASALTLSVAACMTGADASRIAQLPDPAGMNWRVPMLAAHQVNYGQAIAQAVRLAGAQPVLCDSVEQVRAALMVPGAACVLAVESHLAPGSGSDSTQALVAAAHAGRVPLVLDGAAQDRRAAVLVASGADLVLVSAQKYLGAPTAGLVLGSSALVAAVDAQHAGIGRAMKPSKEALAGVWAAVNARQREDLVAWPAMQAHKVDTVAAACASWRGIKVHREADPLGNGFERLWLTLDASVITSDAATVIRQLREGDPAVAVAPHRAAQNTIGLELTGVAEAELPALLHLLRAALMRDDKG